MDAVLEQYVQPMTHALCLLTYVVSRTQDGKWLAEQLRIQADSCPDDVAGKGILHALAEMAESPDAIPPNDVRKRANTSLRLIQGGKKD